jgi:NitT/TauT family transport system substrate-binding protein
MKIKEKYSMLGRIAGSLIALTLCLPAAQVQAADKVKMMFDWIPGGLSGGWYASRTNGCFGDLNLEMTFDRGSGGVDTVAKVAAGLSDIGMADLGTIMLGIDRSGAKVKALTPIYTTSPFGVLTLSNSGVKTLKDLEGRSLASGPGDSAILMLPLAMKMAGADYSKIEHQKADFSALLGLLLQGKIDSHTTFLTTGRILQNVVNKTGKKAEFIHFGNSLGIYGSTIFANEKFLKERPGVARKVIKAVQCTYLAARKDPEATADALLGEFPEKKRGAEMASIHGGIDLVFNTETYKRSGFDWAMDQVQKTYESTMQAQGRKATGDASRFLHIVK